MSQDIGVKSNRESGGFVSDVGDLDKRGQGMSAQLPDRIIFQNREYDIISFSPHKLFDPAPWGLEPSSPHRACLRGTLATFAVKENILHLQDLRYWTHRSPLLGLGAGKMIREEEAGECPGYLYQGINAVIPWSGQLVLGRSFFWPLLLPRGFQPAWKYKEVMQLVFEEGSLRAFGDMSKKIARVRAEVLETVAAAGF